MLIETLINQCKKLRKNMLSNMYKKEKAPLFSQFIWLSTWKLKFNFGKPFRVKKKSTYKTYKINSILASGKMEQMCLSLFCVQLETLDVIYKTHIKRLRSIKKPDWQSTLEPREEHSGNFPGLLFVCFIYFCSLFRRCTSSTVLKEATCRGWASPEPSLQQ